MTSEQPNTWYYVPAPHANRKGDYVPVVVILEHGTKLVFSDLSVVDVTDTSKGSYHRTESEAYRALVANLRLEVEHAAQALRDAEQRLIDVLDRALLVDRRYETMDVSHGAADAPGKESTDD